MSKTAFVFSGQGAQYSGMGKELYDHSAAAKRIFDHFNGIWPGLKTICFEGTDEALKQTVNIQPCVFTVSLAAAEVLKENRIYPGAVAGFSLGEVSALTYSGVFSYADGFKFVLERAGLMQAEAEKNDCAMAAILKIDPVLLEETVKKYNDVYLVNFNCPGQTVASGKKGSLDEFIKEITMLKGRAVKLNVNGAFHSPFMERASEALGEALKAFELNDAKIPVYANLTAKEYGRDIISMLSKQVKSPVLWQKTIENMFENGYDTFVELGPGTTLSSFILKTVPSAKVFNVENKESLFKTLDYFKQL